MRSCPAVWIVGCGLLLAGNAVAQEAAALAGLKQQASQEIDQRQTFTQQMVDQINGFTVERGIAGIPTAWVASYGSGKPVIAFVTDIDCIPRASQKPGVCGGWLAVSC